MAKQPSFIQQLQAAIRSAEGRGMSRNDICKRSGVDKSTMSNLMNIDRPVQIDTAEKILAALGKRLAIIDDYG